MAASKPTPSLSVDMDYLHPFTLNQYLRTLTAVWVVPLSRLTLTTSRRFPASTASKHSEFDGKPRNCFPKTPHQYLYHSDDLDGD